MKKILIQLDTDEHPSTFDAIVAHDAGVDELLRYGSIEPGAVRGLVQSAFFTRGPEDLSTLAVWVGGSSVGAGEAVLGEVEKAFFGPFHLSTMLDSNGCNTTAATTVARLAREMDLKGRRVVVVGAGAVGLRAAKLLIDEGCAVTVSGIPPTRFGDQAYHRARGLDVAQERGMDVAEPADDEQLEQVLDGASLVLAAGPAGIEVLPGAVWRGLDAAEVLADFNAAEPLGIEGTGAQDDLKDYDGKRVLGALAIGGPKMKVHKACVRRLFASNDAILDIDGVYEIAKELA
jgi:methylenetetrahydrofolate/methylenetetrahydromethanopterin dehydrogenase (NADP+)